MSPMKTYYVLEYTFHIRAVQRTYLRYTRDVENVHSRMKVFINDEWMLKGRQIIVTQLLPIRRAV